MASYFIPLWFATQVYYPPGPQVLTFYSSIDDSDQPYALYLPRNIDLSRKWPLVISLHGEGSNHRLDLRRVLGRGNLPGQSNEEASRRFPLLPDVPFLVASPLARGNMGYQGIPEADVYEVLADVKRRFPVDEDRVYLTGLASGGGGALWLALTRPDVWAAVGAVCPIAPAGAEDLAANLLQLPLRLFQGSLDPLVAPSSTRAWHKRLLDLGTPVEYFEYPAARHNAWDTAYRNAAIFDWFARHRRNPMPDRVRFTTSRYRYRSAYWVDLDAFTPGTPAFIDARLTAPASVTIETRNLEGFTLKLASVPRVVTIDGVAVPPAALSFHREHNQWTAGRSSYATGEKRPGAEGPIGEVFSERHLYVYGTQDSPAAQELERRRGEAQSLADWVSAGGRPYLQLRVAADRDLTQEDLYGSNLILLGNRRTNRFIALWSDRFPLELNPGAADYGLVYTFHVNGHNVVVSSGLAWWTSRAPPLSTLADFLFFRGTADNVIARGYFDRQWRLPLAARNAIRAAGAVVIRGE